MEQIKKLREVLKEKETQEQQPYAYWLSCVQGVGAVTAKRLVETFATPKSVYHATEKQLKEVIAPKMAEKILQAQQQDVFESYGRMCSKGIMMVPFYHHMYPKRLRNMADNPFCLYVKGRLPVDERPSLAIVGARNCSEYGRYVAEKFAGDFAGYGVQIISGMAKGVDGMAGGAAIAAGGDTYAVLGCGADVCYPASNEALYQDICEKGGVISEYLPGTEPSPGLFPARNRIISALADAVLVVEARQKSGTLITVDMALEQGREVYVVPGRITDRLSDGCNRLLGQGANPALSPEQMFSELTQTVWREYGRTGEENTEKRESGGRLYGLSKQHRALYQLLDFYLISVEQIWLMVQTNDELQGMTLPRIMEMLIDLCVSGLVKNEGGYYGWTKPV